MITADVLPPGRTTVLTETWLIFQRAMKQSLRNPFWVIIGIVQPLLYLAFFGPLLIPVVQSTPGFPPGDAWQVLVPALLVQLGLFGGLFVGFSVLVEYKAGVIERMRVTPVSRTALLLGRALKDTVVLLVQATLLTVLAVPFGLRAPLGAVIVALALVGVLGLAMACASYALAMQVKSEEAFLPIVQSLFLPLLLLSGILLPMTVAPDLALQPLAGQPVRVRRRRRSRDLPGPARVVHRAHRDRGGAGPGGAHRELGGTHVPAGERLTAAAQNSSPYSRSSHAETSARQRSTSARLSVRIHSTTSRPRPAVSTASARRASSASDRSAGRRRAAASS